MATRHARHHSSARSDAKRHAVTHLVKEQHYPEKLLELKCACALQLATMQGAPRRSRFFNERSFDPEFAIRGLSLDTRRAVLLKLTFLNAVTSGARAQGRGDVDGDASGAPQLNSPCAPRVGTAHLGHRCLSAEEVERLYGSHITTSELARHSLSCAESAPLVHSLPL